MVKFKIFKRISFLAILILGFFGIFFQVQAMIISQVYITEFSIEKNSYKAGEEIKGNFTIWNYEKSVVPDLTYRFKVLAEDEEGFSTVVFDDRPSKDYFFLNPDQKLTKNFSYRLPQNLPPRGDYQFRIQLFNSKGIPMAWKEAYIKVEGDGKFLTLKNYWFLKDGKKNSPKGEASYDSSETPKITFDISNESSFSIQAYPKIIIYKYNINENPIREIKKELLTINPRQILNKEFDLIQPSEPDSYLCQVVVFDQNNNSISNYIYFRWTLSGKKSEIVQIQTDQPSYKEGEEAEVSVDIAVPKETEEEGYLLVKILDERGKTVGEGKKEISLKGGKTSLQVPVTKEVSKPEIETTIIGKDNKKLDEYKTKLETGLPAVKKEIPWQEIVIGTAIFAAVIFIIYFLLKRKRISSVHRSVFFGIILGEMLIFCGGQIAFAATKVGSTNNIAIAWSNPLPEYFYEAGGFVQFSGSIFIPFGFRGLTNNKIEFFVGDESEVKLIDYDTGVNKIKIINEAESNVRKIGEADYPAADQVEYNEVIKIPPDIPYIGKARFYVQFRGQERGPVRRGAKPLWYWIIAYEDVIIQKSGEGGFDITLKVDKTEAELNEVLTYTIDLANWYPCIRIPMDVIEIIDRSSSMLFDQKIDYAKAAAKTFIDVMDSTYDRVGLVTYGTSATLDASLTSDFDSVKSKIDSQWHFEGSTCIGCGIATATDEIILNKRRGTALCEILMTDGRPNEPYPNAREFATTTAQEAANQGIVIYTVGFGQSTASVDEVLLREIADITGGTYSFAPTGEELIEIYNAISGVLIGWSYGTKVILDIPEEYLTLENHDSRCSYDGNVLTCDIGVLECGNKTIVNPITLTARINSTVPDQTTIEMKAEIVNDANKRKASSVGVLIHGNKPPIVDISCNPSNCEQYYGLPLHLINESTDEDGDSDIVKSQWFVKSQGAQDSDYQLLSYCDCSKKCDCTPQAEIGPGQYTAKLYIEDSIGQSATATKDFQILKDAEAGFMCSLDNLNWKPCEELKPIRGELFYFKDDPSLAEHSTTSERATSIDHRIWKINGIIFDSDNNPNPSTNLNQPSNIIELTITDNKGRTVFVSHTILATIPLPEWKEAPPF